MKPASPRRTLLLLAALFALPFLLALVLHLAGWSPGGASHGILLTPPPMLPATGLVGSNGQPLPTTDLAGRWQLLLAGNGPCDATCEADLAAMALIRSLLSRHQERLGLLWLGSDAPPAPLPGLAATADSAWRRALGVEGEGYHFAILDPAGRLVLLYPPGADPTGVRLDLERLLKYSWAG